MSVAAKPEQVALARFEDPFRAPCVRYAMHLIVPTSKGGVAGESRIEVRELLKGVRLYLDIDNDGIGVKSVALSFTEANKLSEMLNTIRRRAADRKAWMT